MTIDFTDKLTKEQCIELEDVLREHTYVLTEFVNACCLKTADNTYTAFCVIAGVSLIAIPLVRCTFHKVKNVFKS